MLRNYNQDERSLRGFQGGISSETEHRIKQAKKIRKTMTKKKDGTDGIDALDELEDHEKINDWFDSMKDYE